MDQVLYFESVPVNSLKIICWIPCRIKQYNNIGTNKIKTQSTSPKNIKMRNQNYMIVRKKPATRWFCIRSVLAYPSPIKNKKDTENSAVQFCVTVVLITIKYSNNHCHKRQFSHVNINTVTDCINS